MIHPFITRVGIAVIFSSSLNVRLSVTVTEVVLFSKQDENFSRS